MIEEARNALRSMLPTSTFARGVSVLVGGTASAQILLVLAAPLLTRLYSPEDFGLLAVYGSLLALIGVVSCLRYELAIPLPEDDQEAANVAVLCLILVAVSVFLASILVAFLGEPIAAALGVPRLADYFWLLPIGVLVSGVYTVFSYWGIRTKRFSTIAATKLRQAIATLAIQLAAFKLGGAALLFGQIAGQGVGTASLTVPALRKPEFKNISRRGIQHALFRYRQFAIFTTWSGLINSAGHQLPPLLFAAFFTASGAGFYALAQRVLAMPASLIGASFAQVFVAHGAEAHREGRLGEMYSKLQDTLIQVGLPPALILILAGPKLFVLAFGDGWFEAGVFAQWLALGVFAGFLVSPLSQIFVILERQRTGLILQAILFLARMAGVGVGIWYDDILLAVSLFSMASVFGYSLYLVIGARYTGCSFLSIVGSLVKSALYSLVLVMPIFFSYLVEAGWVFYVAILLTAIATAVRFRQLYMIGV